MYIQGCNSEYEIPNLGLYSGIEEGDGLSFKHQNSESVLLLFKDLSTTELYKAVFMRMGQYTL